jgi:hypothetical protein
MINNSSYTSSDDVYFIKQVPCTTRIPFIYNPTSLFYKNKKTIWIIDLIILKTIRWSTIILVRVPIGQAELVDLSPMETAGGLPPVSLYKTPPHQMGGGPLGWSRPLDPYGL